MKIILLTHPVTLNSKSMPLFSQMIFNGMRQRGHEVIAWTSPALLSNLSLNPTLKKWLNYFDQFVIFQLIIFFRLLKESNNTLFIFSDQALCMWMLFIQNRPNIIHVHDFLALRSAKGEFNQNRIRFFGRIYQYLIIQGLKRGNYFISVSKNTNNYLNFLLNRGNSYSKVIYNGLNNKFFQMSTLEIQNHLNFLNLNLRPRNFILHVGGNQWYKNRLGVVDIYLEYYNNNPSALPLVMVGEKPNQALFEKANSLVEKKAIIFLVDINQNQLCSLYSSAELLLFPSISEGFGWPIIEAMSCGCLVLTTEDAPMTEVGGDVAYYIKPIKNNDYSYWSKNSAEYMSSILNQSLEYKTHKRELGFLWAKNFNAESTLNNYENFYKFVFDNSINSNKNICSSNKLDS